MARLLLTGASGFVGSHFLSSALQAGHQVAAVTQSDHWMPVGSEVSVLRASSDDAALAASIRDFGPDVAVLLGWGGIPDYSATWSLRSLEANLRGVRLALAGGANTVVASGSCWEYQSPAGATREDTPIRTDAPFQFAKSAFQRLLTGSCEEAGAGWRWARLFYVYGPGQRDEALIPTCIRSWTEGNAPPLKDEDAAIDLVHVQDVADALLSLTTASGPSGVFNVGSGYATRVGDASLAVQAMMRGDDWPLPKSQEGFWADNSAIELAYGWAPRIDLSRGLRQWPHGSSALNGSAT